MAFNPSMLLSVMMCPPPREVALAFRKSNIAGDVLEHVVADNGVLAAGSKFLVADTMIEIGDLVVLDNHIDDILA